MAGEPVSTPQRLELTRGIGFDTLLRSPNPYGTITCPLRPQADSVKMPTSSASLTLGNWGLSHLGDDAALVVSELVTNAIRYACHQNGHIGHIGREGEYPITLLLLRVSAHVLLAVADQSDAIPIPREPDSTSEHGRGLYIVETYSQEWGWDPLARGGKAVWAVFRADL